MAVGKKFGTFSTWRMYFLVYRTGLVLCSNRPFPSSPGHVFQNEDRCSAFGMEIIFHSHANKTNFHNKGYAPSLISRVRVFGTRKWAIHLVCARITLNSGDNHLTNDNKAMALSRELRKSWNHCQVWICANLSHNNLMPQFMGNFICHIIPENTLKILQSV